MFSSFGGFVFIVLLYSHRGRGSDVRDDFFSSRHRSGEFLPFLLEVGRSLSGWHQIRRYFDFIRETQLLMIARELFKLLRLSEVFSIYRHFVAQRHPGFVITKQLYSRVVRFDWIDGGVTRRLNAVNSNPAGFRFLWCGKRLCLHQSPRSRSR